MKCQLLLALVVGLGWPVAAASIARVELHGPVNAIRAEYVVGALEAAEQRGDTLVLLEMNTPGGLGDATRTIVTRLLNSRIPVVAYVSPSGAHAASAGFLILMAADVAAMAEGTNTGAAHPLLSFGGVMPAPEGEASQTLLDKVRQDILAGLRSVVSRRGRNVAAAEKAVTDSTSYSAAEALEQGLVELVAPTREELLRQLDGRTVRLFSGDEVTLRTAGVALRLIEMTQRQRILAFLADPTLALVLAMVGLLGLYTEFTHPGFIFPGVIGGICLILALTGFSMLPINVAGVILLVMAIGFFIAEIKTQGFGVLGVGGIVCLALGFLILVDTPDPSLSIPLGAVLGVVVPVGAAILLLTRLVIQAMRRPPAAGVEGLRLEGGRTVTELTPDGRVFCHGEYWTAVSETGEPIPADTQVTIRRVEGLRLVVRPTPTPGSEPGSAN